MSGRGKYSFSLILWAVCYCELQKLTDRKLKTLQCTVLDLHSCKYFKRIFSSKFKYVPPIKSQSVSCHVAFIGCKYFGNLSKIWLQNLQVCKCYTFHCKSSLLWICKFLKFTVTNRVKDYWRALFPVISHLLDHSENLRCRCGLEMVQVPTNHTFSTLLLLYWPSAASGFVLLGES